MRKYPEYKDSGIEWIGEIPIKWDLKKIKHGSYVKGRIGWKGLKSDEFLMEGFAYLITGTDFNNGIVNWNTCYYIDQERYEEDPFIQLKEGDLLITKDGTIGKVALVKGLKGYACLNSGIFLVRPINGTYDTEFLYWILNSNVFTDFINYRKSGSTISHLYQNVFIEFDFPVPSLKERKTIANFLDHKTRQIDDLIAKKERLIALLKEERTAVINQAVTKGLDPNVQMKDSGIEWLGEIPEYWKVKKIKHIGFLKSGNGIKSDQLEESGEFPVYGGNGMRGYFSEYTHDGEYILIGRQGALCGNINLVSGKFWASEHAVVVELYDPYVLKWAMALFETMNLNQYSISAAQPGLSVEKVNNLKIPVPPLSEQNDIMIYVQEKNELLNKSISTYKLQIELLQEYKTSLINEAVTGKIMVTDGT